MAKMCVADICLLLQLTEERAHFIFIGTQINLAVIRDSKVKVFLLKQIHYLQTFAVEVVENYWTAILHTNMTNEHFGFEIA